MKKSAKAAATESSRSQWLEPLTDAVTRLTDEIRVAREVADELRTDFEWLLQSGTPHVALSRLHRAFCLMPLAL